MAGSWELVGVRPDLSAWSKAIANGYALGAVTGNEKFREAAGRVFVTGSFWCGAVSMAAALATIRKMKDVGAVDFMQRMGQRLRDGIEAQSKSHGVALQQSGPPQMPVILFDNDEIAGKAGFCTEALKHNIYLHATHTMFLSAAHTAADIDRTLEATDAALAEVARQFG
jgi:glutamate-1-semialdehyde 2,1-aminomutase